MPLARVFNGTRVVTTIHDGFLDRLSRWSDIQEYMQFLYETALSYDEPRVLELGSRTGNSTLAFLAAAAINGGHVWSGDIDDITKNPEVSPWKDVPGWTFVHGDDMDPAVQVQFPPEVDIFFLDSSHEYDHTLAELRVYMPRVAPGGIALFHDTHLWGWGGNAPVENCPEVGQALDTYCAETGLTWEDLPGRYGLGMVRA